MFATAFKSSTRLAVALSLTGLTGCASDGGLGEAAVIGAMFLPMPAGVDTSVMTTAVGVAAGAYVLSSVASADSASVSPATSTVAAPQGLPPIDLQKLVTRETPDRYRSKSCEYIEMSLSEVPMYQGSAEPILKQVGTARKEAASQVWLEKGCQLANLPRGKIGANIDTIDPQRAMALSFPPAGVVVLATVPGSGAQQAGLLPQDVIVAVDDRPIADSIDFRVAVAKASIGSRVNLKVWRANAFSIIPVVVGAGGTQVSVTPTVTANGVAAASAVGAMYCTAVLATQHTYGATVSPVKLITGAANDMQPSLKSYIAKVKQQQPGVWGDFKLNSAVCAPSAVVCMAEAKGPTGKTQNAFEFCHATQAKADAELAQMRQGDPKAVVIDWP
ncbi:UNVERIFIED_ORG: membrane-associated protease RseP (regulator of RpoE activity) [Pseudomonas lini]|uniref:PDZ domain-containing protein n=2 Tax=Pseudomonas viciae TaxID=2505979 RepID=A0ABY8P9F5_9PSED|nr:PDZ domain-containing protein [Pseudomonas viciae]UZE84904.1 PDZ domain-containing protein [Pseudomonas viciae]WGO91811.1 PDZ domain-containing protein [Pseudomonas viciae]